MYIVGRTAGFLFWYKENVRLCGLQYLVYGHTFIVFSAGMPCAWEVCGQKTSKKVLIVCFESSSSVSAPSSEFSEASVFVVVDKSKSLL